MTLRPPDGSEEPEAVDPVMLAVLANRGRTAAVLSVEEERLVDAWVAGELAPEAAERAADLVKRNSLAAERVLERRLLDAARQGAAVPQSLEARVLKAAPSAPGSALGGWWRSLSRRQWLGIATLAAAACIAAIAVAPMLQQPPLQIAMATITDRTPLFDTTMRGPGTQRFRDVEIPSQILRTVFAAADRTSQAAAVREMSPYLVDASRPAYLIVDTALRQKLESEPGQERLWVRIYDLDDPRSSNIRSVVGPIPAGKQPYLLSVRP